MVINYGPTAAVVVTRLFELRRGAEGGMPSCDNERDSESNSYIRLGGERGLRSWRDARNCGEVSYMRVAGKCPSDKSRR